MKGLPAQTDFIVVGAGIAALRAAIELAESGQVLLLAKKEFPTFKARDDKSEAEWWGDEDDVILHLQDTVDAGDGLCNPAAVKILIDDGGERIDELLAWGKHHSTKLSFELENPHTRSRRLHAHGDSTAREILRTLAQKVESLKSISVAPFTFVTELRSQNGRVCGISLLDEKGTPLEIACSAVLIATGGSG